MATNVINTSGITTGSDGKVRVSGLSSSIDWKSIVDAQVQARRAPAVQLETRANANTAKVAAYGDFKTSLTAVTTALDKLRSAPGSSTDVFNAKVATGTAAARTGAPSTHVPSDINSLLLSSIGPTAQTGTHTLRITQTAQAQQIRSDSISSTTTALSSLGVTAGSFTLGGKTITLSATDTLQDVRAAINAADAGVSATIVSANATTNYLVLTSSNTGTDNVLAFGGGGTATSDTLGLTAVGAVKTELTAARNAQLDVNGITGIVRQSNSISDILGGVTLNLLKAESDTEITLKIEPDLNTIKGALGEFVEAYNGVRDFFTSQRTAADRNNDGTVADGEVGPLAYDQRLRDSVSRLGQLAASSIGGNADGYRSLSQLGITLGTDYKLSVNDATLDSRLLANVSEVKKLFGFTTSATDSRVTVLSRTAETQSGTYYLSLSGTNGSANVVSANLQAAAGIGTGGADDGSASVAGTLVNGLTGNSKGLGLAFNGAANLGALNDIQITVTRGVADQFYDYFNELSRPSVGGLDTAVTELLTQNQDYAERVSVIDIRLDLLRSSLEGRFTRMETALAQLATLKTTIESYLNPSGSNN